MNDKERREYANYIASCLYGKNHKWESVDDIVDILEIMEGEGWSKIERKKGTSKLVADKEGIKIHPSLVPIIRNIEEANMI